MDFNATRRIIKIIIITPLENEVINNSFLFHGVLFYLSAKNNTNINRGNAAILKSK